MAGWRPPLLQLSRLPNHVKLKCNSSNCPANSPSAYGSLERHSTQAFSLLLSSRPTMVIQFLSSISPRNRPCHLLSCQPPPEFSATASQVSTGIAHPQQSISCEFALWPRSPACTFMLVFRESCCITGFLYYTLSKPGTELVLLLLYSQFSALCFYLESIQKIIICLSCPDVSEEFRNSCSNLIIAYKS